MNITRKYDTRQDKLLEITGNQVHHVSRITHFFPQPLPRRSAVKAGQPFCKSLTKNLQKSSNFVNHLQTPPRKPCYILSMTAKNMQPMEALDAPGIAGHDACRAEACHRRKRNDGRSAELRLGSKVFRAPTFLPSLPLQIPAIHAILHKLTQFYINSAKYERAFYPSHRSHGSHSSSRADLPRRGAAKADFNLCKPLKRTQKDRKQQKVTPNFFWLSERPPKPGFALA